MRRLLAGFLVVVAGCGGSGGAAVTASSSVAPVDLDAAEYSASAMRALEGTAFAPLGESGLTGLIVDLCEGLGVGAIGVAVADTGIDAPAGEVTIMLEVVRTGLDQVCEDRVVIDLTALYLAAVRQAATTADALGAYDEIAVIRAAPIVCGELRSGAGAGIALLAIGDVLFGIPVGSMGDLERLLSFEQQVVAGAVLTGSVALVCPEFQTEVASFLEQV